MFSLPRLASVILLLFILPIRVAWDRPTQKSLSQATIRGQICSYKTDKCSYLIAYQKLYNKQYVGEIAAVAKS